VIIADDGQVKIVDFGIARLDDGATLTRTGQAFGSPAYMAPEQLTGDGAVVDARADLYALGCILFEMLVGHPPFEGGEAISVSFRQVHEAPPPLEAIRPDVPPALAALVERLLAKDPNQRPRSADEVVTMLASPTAVTPAPSDTRQTAPIPNRVQRHWNRRVAPWIPWAVACVVTLVLVALLVQFTLGAEHDASGSRAPRSASAAASSPTSPSVTVSGPAEAAGALLDLVRRLETSGRIDDHTAADIEHTVNDVVHESGDEGDPEKALEKLGELRDKIEEAADEGDVTANAAAQLVAAIERLEASLSGD
jgi:serine/threonine protein kinase